MALLATCARIQPARDVRPLITSLSSIAYKTGVIGYISPGMIDARATDCQPPEACWALRKDATPVIADGASQLASTGMVQVLTAFLSKGKYVEDNYKSILASRLRYWLWAVDPRSLLFGYAVNGKVMFVEPKDFGALPAGAELPDEISGSAVSKIRQLFTVLKRSAMALLFSPLGKLGLLEGVLGDSSVLAAGALLARAPRPVARLATRTPLLSPEPPRRPISPPRPSRPLALLAAPHHPFPF